MKKPLTRVQEVREARGLSKAELARQANNMPPQTLQNIESGKTKSLSLAARRKLAPPLHVREDQLMLPVGFPIPPLEGEQPPITDLMFSTAREMLDELRGMREDMREIKFLLKNGGNGPTNETSPESVGKPVDKRRNR